MPSAKTPENKILQIVQDGLQGTDVEILGPGLDGYQEIIVRWSDAAEKRAAAVVLPNNTNNVSSILKLLRKNEIDFVVSGGRHSTGGASSIEDGVVIDLRKMNNVTVHEENKTLAVQGGCLWKDVDEAAAKYGLATVGGTVNHTGVGGLILGGGFGWLTGRYGLTIDNLLSAELVLADGSIVRASETENKDLFWAIRGAGSSFAVCTEFVLQAYEQTNPVWAGALVFTPDKHDEIIKFVNKFHEVAVDQGMFIVSVKFHGQPVIAVVIFHNGSEEQGREFFSDLYNLGPIKDMTSLIPYEKLNGMINHLAEYGRGKSMTSSAMRLPLDADFVREVFEKKRQFVDENPGTEDSMLMMFIIPFKKLREVPLEAMAYCNRGFYFNCESVMMWNDPSLVDKCRAHARSLQNMIRERGGVKSDQAVGNYANTVDHQVDATKVFGVNTQRLKELKKIYDPDNVFRRWHDINYVEKEKNPV